jgi:septum formation protein
MRVILASKSPRRKRLLRELGLAFKVVPSHADESVIEEDNPVELVRKLAMLKAASVAKGMKREHAVIIGADTIVLVDNEILGKPANRKQAKEMLDKLSGREHKVYTGICVINTKTGNVYSDTQKTRVRFRKLNQREISSYASSDSVMDWAGAYAIQSFPTIIGSTDGSLTNVIGLPIEKLMPLLRENGVNI